ncbi:SDR family oxidoreductase [Algivirga pacifica]|uniref:SDR family oxidoreductase n=1 Tax=Algivirga pacifica TaxID=1162670 RepID=A0ABP9DAB5_9BACT
MERKLHNRKVLVTGGAGFIGANLIESLLVQDNHVTCLDNFSTGKRHNITSFLDHPNFTLIEGDIREPKDCEKAVHGVEFVFHQAALGSVPRSINDPKTTNDVNITGFLNMLIASRNAGVKRFIYAASSSTYGDHPGLPKVEDKIGRPLSPYAVTKYVNELYADVFSKTYGIETIGLRYFNVFGRKQDPESTYAAVIPKFIDQLLKGQQPTINGKGLHSRDFTYIDNVIQMNQLAALTNNKEAINTVYNVACGDNHNLNQLLQTLIKYLSVYQPAVNNITPIHGPERTGDIPHSLADISKAQTLLGYQPSHSFTEGLKETVDWYWETYGSPQ